MHCFNGELRKIEYQSPASRLCRCSVSKCHIGVSDIPTVGVSGLDSGDGQTGREIEVAQKLVPLGRTAPPGCAPTRRWQAAHIFTLLDLVDLLTLKTHRQNVSVQLADDNGLRDTSGTAPPPDSRRCCERMGRRADNLRGSRSTSPERSLSSSTAGEYLLLSMSRC